MKTKHNFEFLLRTLGARYDLYEVFSDFLSLFIAVLAEDSEDTKAYTASLYSKTMRRYHADAFSFDFPGLFYSFMDQMEARIATGRDTDLLGDFYEAHIQKQGDLPLAPICVCNQIAARELQPGLSRRRPQRIIDLTCGSGRMLLALAEGNGWKGQYLGIDNSEVRVKITVVNLFLCGIRDAEVMQADPRALHSFKVSYRIKANPHCIQRIERKVDSPFWLFLQEKLEPGKMAA